jgi:hypothetical protein
MLANDLDARAEIQLKQAQALLGMDPREDLHAITVYGSGVDQDNAVMLIRGKFNSEKVAAAAAVMPGMNCWFMVRGRCIAGGSRRPVGWTDAWCALRGCNLGRNAGSSVNENGDENGERLWIRSS